MHRPILRIICFHVSEVFFLVSLTLTLFDPLEREEKKNGNITTRTIRPYDLITTLYIASYLLESFVLLYRRNSLKIFTSFWQTYDFVRTLLMVIGGLMMVASFQTLDDDNRANESGNHGVNVGATIFIIGATLSLLKPLRWLVLQRQLGPLVVTIMKVLKDVAFILIIYAIFFGAFTLAFCALFQPFYQTSGGDYILQKDNLLSLWGASHSMFWSLLDPGNSDYATVFHNGTDDCKNSQDFECMSNQFSHFVNRIFWGTYQCTTVIMLLNLLIAMSEY